MTNRLISLHDIFAERFISQGGNAAKSESCQLLKVIEGQHEPKNMQHVVKETIDFFKMRDAGGMCYLSSLLMSMCCLVGVCFRAMNVSCALQCLTFDLVQLPSQKRSWLIMLQPSRS